MGLLAASDKTRREENSERGLGVPDLAGPDQLEGVGQGHCLDGHELVGLASGFATFELARDKEMDDLVAKARCRQHRIDMIEALRGTAGFFLQLARCTCPRILAAIVGAAVGYVWQATAGSIAGGFAFVVGLIVFGRIFGVPPR